MADDTVDDDHLVRLFMEFDRNSDGLVDEAEFRIMLNALGEDPSDEILSLEFAVIDSNSDGLVEFSEFRRWWVDSQ